MFVYHERHKDAHGKIVLTEMRMSSYGDGRLEIKFYDLSEKTKFNLCVEILKWPPVAFRMYETKTYVWSFLNEYGEQVLEKLRAIMKPFGGLIEYPVEDLANQVLQGRIDFSVRKKMRPEDFFYNTAPQGAAALTREQIREKLAALFQTNTAHLNSIDADKNALKKLYRTAAMRLHPDRNNGDGSKMSDLNMYWGLYNS